MAKDNFPAVLVLKRKSIRQYPDDISVALYYSETLDKYFTIPGQIGTTTPDTGSTTKDQTNVKSK